MKSYLFAAETGCCLARPLDRSDRNYNAATLKDTVVSLPLVKPRPVKAYMAGDRLNSSSLKNKTVYRKGKSNNHPSLTHQNKRPSEVIECHI